MWRGFVIVGVLLGGSVIQAAAGDVVHLVNGDRITGRFQEMTAGYVVFATEYAGLLQLPQDAVAAIETSVPVNVLMKDGAALDGVLEFQQGESGVRNEEGWQSVSWQDVDSIRAEEAPAAPQASEVDHSGRHWSGEVDTGLELRRGNTDTTDFNMGVTIVSEAENDTLTLRGAGAYGEADNVLDTRNYMGEAKWQVYPQDRLYVYGLLSAEHDDARKLDLRAQGGGGVGYDFIRNDKRTFSGDLGVTYTYERWDPYTPQERDSVKAERRRAATQTLTQAAAGLTAGNVIQSLGALPEAIKSLANPLSGDEQRTDEFANMRLSAQYAQRIFERSTISEQVTVQPNLDDFGEYRLTSDLAFTTPISKALGLRMNLVSEFDSQADDRGIDSWDNRLQTGLQYEFGGGRKAEASAK